MEERTQLTDQQVHDTWQRLARFNGAVDSGDPHAADNDRIDADLAREYADSHSDER